MSRDPKHPHALILRVRHATGGQLEHQLDPQYTFAQVVSRIDAALDDERPLKLALLQTGQDLILDPDATMAIALLEP